MKFKVLCLFIVMLFSGFCLSKEPVKYQFYRAAKAGNIEEINRLKKMYNINDTSGSGLEGSALNIAVNRSDKGAVNMLLFAGASTRIEGWNEGFPMHIAAVVGDVEMIRLLGLRGVDANAVNRKGYSPVHSTAWFGQVSAFRALHELGAYIHKRVEDNNEESLLHLVARRGLSKIY